MNYCRKLVEALIEAGTELWGAEHTHVLSTKSRLSDVLRELGEYDASMALQNEIGLAKRINALHNPFQKDDIVQITGLVGAPQHNGKRCIVTGFKADSGRVVVAPLLSDAGSQQGKNMAIKPANLKLLEKLVSHQDQSGSGGNDEMMERATRANLLGAQGRFDEAAELFKQNHELCVRLYGPLHEHTINQLMAQANMHIYPGLQGDAGHLSEARKLLEMVVEQNTQLFGAKHARTLTSKSSLAGAVRRTVDRARCRELLEEVVEGLITQLGRSHQDTIGELSNLAGALMEVGELERAEPLMREAIAGMTAHFGAQNPKTLQTMFNFCVFLNKGGRYEEALPIAEEVAAGRLRAMGSENPMTQSAVSLADTVRHRWAHPEQRPDGWQHGPARLYATDLAEQADSHASSGDFGNMFACAGAACTADPSFWGGFFLAGSALVAQFKNDEAVAELEQALRLAGPVETPRIVALIDQLQTQRAHDPARTQAEQLCHQADACGKQHRVEDMLNKADRAAAVDPTYFGGYAIRGRLFSSRGRTREALEDLQMAYDLAAEDGVFMRGDRDFGVSGFLPQVQAELARGHTGPSGHGHQESMTVTSMKAALSRLEFQNGDRVQISGLKGAPQHNGHTAVVQRFDAKTGRYVVKADVGGAPMKIKPANLSRRDPEPES